MAENVIFQTKTFGGFDKKSVLEYIDKAAEQARKKEEEFNKQLSQMQQKNKELEEEKDTLTQQLEDSGEKNQELSQMLEKIEKELSACKQERDTQNEKMAQAVKQNLELKNALSLHKEKSRKYDEISSRLSETILHAQKTAEEMVEEAKAAASKITCQNQQDCEDVRKKMKRFQKEVSDLKYCIGEAFASLDKQMALLTEAVDKVAGSLDEEIEPQKAEESPSPLC